MTDAQHDVELANIAARAAKVQLEKAEARLDAIPHPPDPIPTYPLDTLQVGDEVRPKLPDARHGRRFRVWAVNDGEDFEVHAFEMRTNHKSDFRFHKYQLNILSHLPVEPGMTVEHVEHSHWGQGLVCSCTGDGPWVVWIAATVPAHRCKRDALRIIHIPAEMEEKL
jgi:hypothetical protein